MIKVGVWGKFENIHQGHLDFLNYSKSLGDELYVIVVSDKSIKENEKRDPLTGLDVRIENIEKLKIANRVYSGEFPETIETLINNGVGYFVFGHDQDKIWKDKLINYYRDRKIKIKFIEAPVFNDGLHNHDNSFKL